MNRALIKRMAKEDLKGAGGYMLTTLLFLALSSVVSSITSIPSQRLAASGEFNGGLITISVICFIIGMAVDFIFTYGYTSFALKLSRRQEATYNEMFSGFGNFGKVVGLNILILIFTGLWSLLLFIPGLIKAYSYRMAVYNLIDNPEIGIRDAITKSRKMMDGHKMDLFLLELSFIPWSLLILVTVGIAAIWVLPYIQTTYAHFYEQVKNEYEGNIL